MGFLNSVKSRIQGIVPSHGEEAYPDQENSYSEDTGSPFTAAEGIPLPHTDYWSENYPTTTYIDEKTHLLTSTTEGVTDIPDDMTIYSLYADRARRTGDGRFSTSKITAGGSPKAPVKPWKIYALRQKA